MSEQNNGNSNGDFLKGDDPIQEVLHVSDMYENWFLDYASYVILERAVPHINDGLKPVQRRILHAMKEMDDGRFNKVANIIGSTMQYHPHGDASIGDAIIGLGQKELLLDTQGNWGDMRTGDSAAAPRYIESRLSKFALDVIFNKQTTEWQLSYDGRKKEPVTFPVKFPLLLAQGVEGIAVGLSTRILPHNFVELVEACIGLLRKKKVLLYPDFPTGGLADFSDYNEGRRGGKVRVRAKIEELDKKTLLIRDIPYTTTTSSLIESIIKANDKGKIKIKQVVDNTAKDVEILVYLAAGQSPDITIDALYAFTDCEQSISPNACVIIDDRPVFLSVNEILKVNNDQTVELLRRELEIKKAELLEKILFSSLERIFIENRIYRDIEECETWESVIETIDKGLEPFKPQFYRDINRDDIIRLTEIKIKRISRYDAFKADELLNSLQEELKETEYNLNHITDFAIAYYKGLLAKYGKGRERKTEIRTFDTIQATVVAANNAKLYVDRQEGFIGFGIKKEEYVCDCSDLDDIIVFRADGKMVVTRIAEKVFVGKHILHVGVFDKNDERMVYNMAYVDGDSGRSMVKRFRVLGITRDKDYDLTKGSKGSRVHYFTANPNGEAETIAVQLSNRSRARIKSFDFDFSDLDIKGRGAGGNILTRYPVKKIQLKSEGRSTLGGVDIYYDYTVGRLNRDQRGRLLGNFKSGDLVFVIHKNGSYELMSFELTNRYDPELVLILEKFDQQHIVTAIYLDGSNRQSYVKRFRIETSSTDKMFSFISDAKGSKLQYVSIQENPVVEVTLKKKRSKEKTDMRLAEMIDVKGWKSIGKRVSPHSVINIADKISNAGPSSEQKESMSAKNDVEYTKSESPHDPDEKGKKEVEEAAKTVKKEKKASDKQPHSASGQSKSDTDQEKKEKPEQHKETGSAAVGGADAFHIGDTIEFNIPPKQENGQDDQLDLFQGDK